MQERAQREPVTAPPGFRVSCQPAKRSRHRIGSPDNSNTAQARTRPGRQGGKRALSLCSGVLLLVAVSCDSSPSATSDDDASYVTVPMPPVVVAAGTTVQLSAPSSLPGGGTPTWQSSATSVATVTSSGLMRGVAAGQAVISANVRKHRATWSVTVEAPALVPTVTTIGITPGTVALQVGGTAQLTAEARDQNGEVMVGPTFTWESANAAVATVSASGVVTAVGAGTVAIQAQSGGKSGTATVTVTQQPPVVTTIAVTPATASVQAGATTQLTAVAKDQYGNAMSGVAFTWSTANPAVATVSSSGLAWGVAAGEVAIMASSGGKSASATVTVTQQPPVLTTIAVSPATASVVTGATVQLTAVAKDQNGNTMSGVTFAWSSASTATATVSASGLVRGVAAGAVAVTASSGGKSASATVTVTQQPPVLTTIAVTPATVSVQAGATTQLTAVAKDQNGNPMSGVTLTWASANPAVATVSASGLVTGVTAGTAAITATSGASSGDAGVASTGPSASSSVSVTAAAPVLTSIAVTPASVSLNTGATAQLSAVAKDQYGNTMSGVTFTWSSASPATATVSASGLVTGVAAGTVAITASSGGKSGSSAATVTAPAPVVTTVTLAPATATLTVGATVQLTRTVKDQSGATMTGVSGTYASSNAAVASVSSSGMVSGVAAGQATITATVSGKSATSVITVNAPTSGSAAPPSTGIWIGKSELNAIPMGSNGWSGSGELKATADAAWAPQKIEQQNSQYFNVQVMAGALVFARLYPDPSAEAYRTKVVQALRQAIALPDSTGASVTAPSRHLGAFVIAADLINLRSHDPALDNQFRAWLTHKLDVNYQSGSPSIRLAAWNRPNNIGAYSRFSLAAAAAYLGDRATLDRIALVMRRWLGDTRVNHEFKWYDVSYTWQMNPSSSSTWVGVNPRGATRDGNNFDGLQPEEQERGSPTTYDAATFPNDHSSVRYNEVALEAHLATVLILHRAGYTDLIDVSDQAMLRAAKWIKYAADNYSAKGYRYFTDNREAARPLINYFYRSAGLPESRTRDQVGGRAFGFTWTYWTHGGRSIR